MCVCVLAKSNIKRVGRKKKKTKKKAKKHRNEMKWNENQYTGTKFHQLNWKISKVVCISEKHLDHRVLCAPHNIYLRIAPLYHFFYTYACLCIRVFCIYMVQLCVRSHLISVEIFSLILFLFLLLFPHPTTHLARTHSRTTNH